MTPSTKPKPGYWRLRPHAPAPGTRLVALADIPDGTAREFVFGKGASAFSMFAVRRGDDVFGYLNICPHYSQPLNNRGQQFLNADGTRIRCTMHFAEFRIEDGFGISGAAENCWLDPVPLTVDDGEINICD